MQHSFQAVLFSVLFLCTAAVQAQQLTETNPPPEEPGIEIEAERLEYEADDKVFIAIGNVFIQDATNSLSADYMRVNTVTKDIHARGNITFTNAGRVWTGDEFHYNYGTRTGDFGKFELYEDPYYIQAEESRKLGPNKYELERIRLSTCDEEHPEFYVGASGGTVEDGVLRVKHSVAYLAGVPIMYLPYVKKNLNKPSNWDFKPGYSSRMGAFLLSAYNFPVNEEVRSITHLDYRTRRGPAVGQDFEWRDLEGDHSGKIQAYVADDDRPYEDDEDPEASGNLVENERYRLRLQHTHRLDGRSYAMGDMSYLSDPDVVEDFFDDEYRGNRQPENRVSFVRSEDRYSASLNLSFRLNDFYENVNRLPEGKLDFNRQRLGDSGFYYEGESSGAFLERVYPELSDNEEYDALRLDSAHTVLYPTRHFGFLNLIPRAGYRLTYYNASPGYDTVTNSVTETDTNGISFVTNEVSTLRTDEGRQLRHLFELGGETSFKAFKRIHDSHTTMGRGLRHVVEPYARYTFIPEPNVTPDELYQFDSIDSLNERHDVRLGVRNKFQTKRPAGGIHDLVDIETYTTLRLDPDPEQDDFTDLVYDAELRLLPWLDIDFDGTYDWYENTIQRFNTQVALKSRDQSRLSAEYRFEEDRRDQIEFRGVLYPQGRWSFSGRWRYALDESETEEVRFGVSHKFDCVGVSLGVKQVDDDVTVWGQLWILALPETRMDLGR